MTAFNCTNGNVVTPGGTTKAERILNAAKKYVGQQQINFYTSDGSLYVDVDDRALTAAQRAQLALEIKNATN